MNQKQKTTPFKIKLLYALGQFGWSLGSFAVANLLLTFYVPPETKSQYNFPEFISSDLIFGLTVVGIIAFSGRFLDAITDPLIANFSDKFESKIGKRKPFLIFSALLSLYFHFWFFIQFQIAVQ